jgi:glycosyltransferase involved in cell wall biosynthesis
MNLIQLTPGTGGMYCGNCFRDNALVAELRKLGHEALMVPLYLPLKLDEPDQSAGTPVFFGGINVYLEQKLPLFSGAPKWLRNALSSRSLLARAAGHSAKTRAEDVGDILISMLQGEEGRQAREIDELTAWLKTQPHPEVICLSNALLLGMARQLKRQLNTRLVCFLQGEDAYLDSLATAYRDPAWKLLRTKAAEVDLFIVPNQYYAGVMIERLALPTSKVRVVADGIRLEGYLEVRQAERGVRSGNEEEALRPDATRSAPHQTLGYFARMCPEKGLHLLVDAFIQLRRRGTLPDLRLKVGGGCGPAEEPFVAGLKQQLAGEGLADAVSFHPNLDRQEKIAFLQSLDVFSVPATYPEAFGMYLVEAQAAGVPVVQPRFTSFPEFVQATGGGVLYEPDQPGALAEALNGLLSNPARSRSLGSAGQRAVHEKFSAEAMAQSLLAALRSLTQTTFPS